MPMLARHLNTLEFPEIVRRLAGHTTFSAGRSLAEGLYPQVDELAVQKAQDVTEEARRLLEVRPGTGVRGAHDVRSHASRAAIGASLQPSELLEVAGTIGAGRGVKNLLLRQEAQVPTLARHARSIESLDALEEAIRLSFDDDGRALDTASDRLRTIRMELRAAYDRLMRRLNELLTSSALGEALQDSIITMRAGRYVLPVKADFRGRVPGIVHDQSASGATLFVEPLQTVELANRWREREIEEQHEIERILQELSNRVGQAQYALIGTVDALAAIDLAFAKGRLALEMEATRPALASVSRMPSGAPVVGLRNARHPLLRGDVVPISLELGREFDALVITGPNTGGKTVALKTVGLLALMAQAGLQIPADEGSSLGIFSGIYADIGDEQSIAQNLSTFSSHISRIVEILSAADRHSLVLLDEIGAGTDPQEGSALSQALLAHLVRSRIFTIATSHYSELKSFAYATPRVENASVEFDPETLRPTFHLTVGLPGRSNALAIAERLGVPPDVLTAARDAIHPAAQQADELLAEIHDQRAQARDERAAAARLRLEAERESIQLRSRQQEIERERLGILTRADEEASSTLADLRREADALRRELRGMRAERERLAVIEESIERLGQASRTAARQRRQTEASTEPTVLPEVGDYVLVPSLASPGLVRALTANGEMADVEVDGKRVRVRREELQRSQARPTPTPRETAVTAGYLQPRQPRRITADTWSPIESQLDLRGLTTEEARQRVDQYLNDAFMEGLNTVRIVHGKGTGAVRQAVRDVLSDHPLVRSHETAPPREGGDGATVVLLAS
jgi:DNA mismatch repair protein MutS2